jgi:uncharacterized protein (UPF0335 family)
MLFREFNIIAAAAYAAQCAAEPVAERLLWDELGEDAQNSDMQSSWRSLAARPPTMGDVFRRHRQGDPRLQRRARRPGARGDGQHRRRRARARACHRGGHRRRNIREVVENCSRACRAAAEQHGTAVAEGTVAADQLRLFIERIERLEEEKKGIADDVRDVYAEAKANGYDPKIMRLMVRLRKMETHTRQEQAAVASTYATALGIQWELAAVSEPAIPEASVGRHAPTVGDAEGQRWLPASCGPKCAAHHRRELLRRGVTTSSKAARSTSSCAAAGRDPATRSASSRASRSRCGLKHVGEMIDLEDGRHAKTKLARSATFLARAAPDAALRHGALPPPGAARGGRQAVDFPLIY